MVQRSLTEQSLPGRIVQDNLPDFRSEASRSEAFRFENSQLKITQPDLKIALIESPATPQTHTHRKQRPLRMNSFLNKRELKLNKRLVMPGALRSKATCSIVIAPLDSLGVNGSKFRRTRQCDRRCKSSVRSYSNRGASLFESGTASFLPTRSLIDFPDSLIRQTPDSPLDLTHSLSLNALRSKFLEIHSIN